MSPGCRTQQESAAHATPTVSALLALLLMAACGSVQAQNAAPPQWWGNLNLGSTHFGGEDDFLDEGDSFNEFNPGIGVEVQWQRDTF